MFKHVYEIPTEEVCMRLPLDTLKLIAKTNQISISGSKQTIIRRLFKRWNHASQIEWTQDSNAIETLRPIEIIKRGKVQSSFSFVSWNDLYLPVFDHVYQER